jgi:hypothetical protein
MYYSQSPPLMTGEEISSGGRARDLDDQSDQHVRMRSRNSTIDALRSSSLKNEQVARRRPSIGRRILRTLTRFFVVALIGVGATLAWQSYGDTAKEMLVARVPTLAWLVPVSTTKSPVMASTPADPMPKLESMASSLDDMRRSLEQLSAKQEETAQNIAALRAVEESVRQQVSSAPPSPSQQAASTPQPKPAQSRIQPSSASRLPPPTGPVSLSR